MFRLCLFDLDQTLVDTQSIEGLRRAGVHRKDADYVRNVQEEFRTNDRHIISEGFLLELKREFPNIKLGILTRSPRRYVDAVLRAAFPDVPWDTIVAYEDVRQCKPHREGIYTAMRAVGMRHVSDLDDVLLVGDGDVDVRAAYHAGCKVALFRQGWPHHYESSHWRSMSLLPDAIALNQDDLLTAIMNPASKLPDLECLMARSCPPPASPRFDQIGKFFPNDRTRHIVHTAGRSFAGYESLNVRRERHALSQSILDNKDSEVFPDEWVYSIKRFIASHYALIADIPFGDDPELVITAVPPRPGRVHRLGHLVDQLRASFGENQRHIRLRLTFDSAVMAYRPGVQSHSRDHLNNTQRFANVQHNLYVVNPPATRGRMYLVIDDVSTTGASLLYAQRYLLEGGAQSVDCLSLAQNISDPLRG